MTEPIDVTVSDTDFELAVKAVIQWHKQNKVSVVIVNAGSGIVATAGNRLEIESALNHAHKMVEAENISQLMQFQQVREAREQK